MKPYTILIVEDEPENAETLAVLLEPDYELAIATTGEAALDLLPAVDPDLVLLDIMLPGIDGYEVCARMKRDPRFAEVPVIFITALNAHEEEERGLEAGAADYVTKPFSPAVIRVRVRNQMQLRRTRTDLMAMAACDGLTGLANRRRFDEVLAAECRRLGRNGGWLSLILLDIDRYKEFNDFYGHVAGDECLRQVALVLAQAVGRAPDTAARYGGDEFACVLPESDVYGGLSVARKIHAAVADLAILHEGSGIARYVTLTIGLASMQCTPSTMGIDAVALADTCLYRAKAAGRNRVAATQRTFSGGVERNVDMDDWVLPATARG